MREIEFISEVNSEFEAAYLKVRQIEGFVYSNEQVMSLPNIARSHPHHAIWKKRRRTLKRVIPYFTKKKLINILDVGCGNGWFTSILSDCCNDKVIGLDVNLQELNQANELFSSKKVNFLYGSIFDYNPSIKFDLIVFNASIQYFSNLELLLNAAKDKLNEHGEIHILDSRFYESRNEVDLAEIRSQQYYEKIGHEEMSQFYHHHLVNGLQGFEVLVKQARRNLLLSKEEFGWYRFKNKPK